MPSTTSADAVTDGDTAPAEPPQRRGSSLVTHVLLAALTLLLGFGLGLYVPNLSKPADDSPEAGFLRDMSLHHAQAVDMGMIAYSKATLPDVRSVGLDIGLTQHGQVNIMQTWLRGWDLNPNGDQPPMAWMPDGQQSLQDGLMPGMATQQQMEQLRQAEGKQVDILFLTMMRQHHLGGIHMAQEILELSDNKDVTSIARTMAETQQYELGALSELLKKAEAL